MGQKTAPNFHCNYFVYSEPIFIIIFGTCVHYMKLATGQCISFFYKVVTQTTLGGLTIIVRPPIVVCVTTL